MTVGGLGGRTYEQVVTDVLGAAHAVVRADDIVYVTQGLDIAWVSDSVGASLGWEPDELIGQPALTLVSPNQDRSWVDANRHRLLAGRDVVQRLLIRAKDGAERWCSGVAHPIPDAQGVSGFVVVLEPIEVDDPGRAFVPRDELTGLEKRQSILSFLDIALEQPDDLCILLVEFENLRVVNESLGHSAGDVVLLEFADRMRASLAQGERIGRVSGKSFLIACLQASPVGDLASRSTALVHDWSREMSIDGRRIEPSILAAVVEAREGSTSLTLMRDAHVALSQARRSSSPVTVFTPEMSDLTMRRFVLEDELRFAVDAHEFDLHYQPIVSLRDRSMVAAEALVRWNHPREGMLSPASFLPVAEDSRLIRPIGRQVMAKAFEALSALPPHAIQIGVNVSAVELSDDGWLDSIGYAIDRSGIDPCCLVLEITETSVINARRDLAADLRSLRDRGLGVFLDDFGTGYSSLSMLRDLPVTGIKLDKSFVGSLDDQDSFGSALARGIIALMDSLGISGVAEGIEEEAQAERLAELGWEFGQGYLFGRPGPLSDLPPVLARPLSVPRH